MRSPARAPDETRLEMRRKLAFFRGFFNVAPLQYGCEYGIVVANNTKTIERKENVIYIPPMTFSFL